MVCVVDLIVPPLFVVLISLRIFHCPDEVRKEYCSVRQSVQGLKKLPYFPSLYTRRPAGCCYREAGVF